MMNNGLYDGPLPDGFVVGPMEGKLINRNFSWASMMLMLFYLHEGSFAKLETVADFKKAFSDFNDFIQQMDIPEPEVNANEF